MKLEAMGLDVHASVAHTVWGQTVPVITLVGNVIKVVTLDTMETDVPGPAAVTVLDLTAPVTVPVEPVRQAVMPGTMEASVENVAATVQEIKLVVEIVEPVIVAIQGIMEKFVTRGVVATAPGHTTPVTVPVEHVKQAVSQGTEDQSVLNVSKVTFFGDKENMWCTDNKIVLSHLIFNALG